MAIANSLPLGESPEVIAKAKRRIKRFLRTGQEQRRIRWNGDGTFTWRGGVTYGTNLTFRIDCLGRVYRIKEVTA